MKRIILISYIIALSLLLAVILINKNKSVDIVFYTLRENHSYVYKEDENLTFNIYSLTKDPLIIYKSINNYSLKLDTLTYSLEVEDIIESYSEDVYKIKIKAKLPNITKTEYISEKCILEITNSSYKLSLDMGTFSIIDKNYYKELRLDHLEGSYSLYNNSFELSGLNIKITNDYRYLLSLRIGGFTYGTLSKTQFGSYYENELNINNVITSYNPTVCEKEYILGIKDNIMFVPIGYEYLYFVRGGYLVLDLNGTKYLFDRFDFLVSDISYKSYKNKMILGEMKNA